MVLPLAFQYLTDWSVSRSSFPPASLTEAGQFESHPSIPINDVHANVCSKTDYLALSPLTTHIVVPNNCSNTVDFTSFDLSALSFLRELRIGDNCFRHVKNLVLTNLGGAQFNIIDVGDGATRLTALLGGEVDATSLPYSTAADYIANGQLKSLCTCLSKAPDLLPDQKVASETIPELIIDTEYVLLAPKGTPAEIVEAMNAAVLEATSTDDWKTMVNNYCFQNPFVLNVEDTIANLTEQRNLFQSFVPFL